LSLTSRLVDALHAAHALRPEVQVGDLALLFEAVQAVQVADLTRTKQLRLRYLALLLDALHFLSLAHLPGSAPSLDELSP